MHYAQLKPTFHKVNIHSGKTLYESNIEYYISIHFIALTPRQIEELLSPAFEQAKELQQIAVVGGLKSNKMDHKTAWQNQPKACHSSPFVTVGHFVFERLIVLKCPNM